MNSFSSTTTERRYQSILFKRDVIHLPSRRSSSSSTTSMRNIHLILPRKVAPPVSSDGLDFSNKQDLLHVSSAICNDEDLSPFIRKAFASSHPETLLYNLHSFTHSREFEIEEVCSAHYQDFILTIDDLRSLPSNPPFPAPIPSSNPSPVHSLNNTSITCVRTQ